MVFFLGAICKESKLYVLPNDASKNNTFICPDCGKDVIVKKGNIIRHHFAHKRSNTPCNFYNSPNESQIHKDAKLLLQRKLSIDHKIKIFRTCFQCNTDELIDEIEKNPTDNIRIELEHKFTFNDHNRFADVAYLILNKTNDKELYCFGYIFEIFFKHRTNENNRPEPWYEINALNLINQFQNTSLTENNFTLKCQRTDHLCTKCKENTKQKTSFEEHQRQIMVEKHLQKLKYQISNSCNNQISNACNDQNKNNDDGYYSADDADIMRQMRRDKQMATHKKFLKMKLDCEQNDVNYEEGNHILSIINPITKTKIRWSPNKAFIGGKWHKYIKFNDILCWYKYPHIYSLINIILEDNEKTNSIKNTTLISDFSKSKNTNNTINDNESKKNINISNVTDDNINKKNTSLIDDNKNNKNISLIDDNTDNKKSHDDQNNNLLEHALTEKIKIKRKNILSSYLKNHYGKINKHDETIIKLMYEKFFMLRENEQKIELDNNCHIEISNDGYGYKCFHAINDHFIFPLSIKRLAGMK